uniref:Uncharacterized protein n=1 Tax=Anguilla anguilla TaxID=7936 RepID=A0A0E9VVM9_ANGAN
MHCSAEFPSTLSIGCKSSQNADKTKASAHISPILSAVRRLPVSSRIDFKILLLVYKAQCDLTSACITDMKC